MESCEMFFITQSAKRPGGYVVRSESRQWAPWLECNIPPGLNDEVKRRLVSNLKHLMVGLELKGALIAPHYHRGPDDRPVLFEPYFQNLILEFCVAVFSVMEGLGAAHWLGQEGQDGGNAPYIRRDQWLPALCAVYDETCEYGLDDAVRRTAAVRDKLHQDRLGARENIDWHDLSYEAAFAPASHVICTLLRRGADAVPETSNLGGDSAGAVR